MQLYFDSFFQISPLFSKAEQKNKLLRSVAGGGVEMLGTLQARWDKFELMMESHQLMVKEQVRGLGGRLDPYVDNPVRYRTDCWI